jgi:type II secretory ATPase GspE/PulE/Tfp pilus assembly ATPase PilB-like protein
MGNPGVSDIRDQAVKQGMVTMLQDGYLKLIRGVTSLEEVRRVLG